MNEIDTALERLRVNRVLTLRFLDYLALLAASEARERGTDRHREVEDLLADDPTAGAAGSIGWNLMHIAVYEESCGSRLPPELWDRFRHGAPPGTCTAPLATIAERLAASREDWLAVLERWRDEELDGRPPATSQPEMTRRELIQSAVWHEPHHLAVCWDLLRRRFTG